MNPKEKFTDVKMCANLKCPHANPRSIHAFDFEYHQPDGRHPWCHRCIRDPKQGYKEFRKRQVKGHALKYKYGITIDEYDKMFESQNGCCAICNRPSTEMKRALATDHDHITGKVRGLLCDTCNRGLGYFKDSLDLVNKVSEYLKTHLFQKEEIDLKTE